MVKDRRADREIGDILVVASARGVDADQRKALRALRAAPKEIAQNRQQLRADVGSDDARIRKSFGQRNNRIAGPRSDIDDQRGIGRRARHSQRLVEQKTPILDIEIRSMIFIGALEELRRYSYLGGAKRASRRQDARQRLVLRAEIQQRLGEDFAGIHRGQTTLSSRERSTEKVV